MNKNFIKAKAIESQNKKRLLVVNPKLDEKSGIYFLTRENENGIKFGYIGQAKHLLTRIAQHMGDYKQHIDRSLKTHGLYDENNNPHGWKIDFIHFELEKLDEMEQFYIKKYALAGYQLRNKTSGSQGAGKTQIAEYKAPKGYRDGLEKGRKNLAKELNHIIEKHLIIDVKPEKKNNKVSQKAFEKFNNLLSIENNAE